MENNSIFNKLNQIKEEKAESKVVNKEQMHQEVLLEIEELKQKKQEYLDLYEKITSEKAELFANHEEYKKALEGVLAVFENEEAKALLAEQGVDGVQGLLREHPDTDEAKNLVTADASVKENLAKLKELKAEVIEKFNIKNSDFKSLRGVASFVHMSADEIDRKIFEKSIDTVEGRVSWPVSYPTGAWHKETKLEKDIKESKEPKIREIYHELGDRIDVAFLDTIQEYKPTDPRDTLTMGTEYKEGRHVISRSSIRVEDNTITFHFGGGYSSLEYTIKQNDQGQLFFSRKDEYKALLPNDFLQLFNKKLRQVDDSFKSVAENI